MGTAKRECEMEGTSIRDIKPHIRIVSPIGPLAQLAPVIPGFLPGYDTLEHVNSQGVLNTLTGRQHLLPTPTDEM